MTDRSDVRLGAAGSRMSGAPRAAPGQPARQLVLDRPATVGRAHCDVVVDDPAVSRRHLLVEPADAGLRVLDLGSRNGTTVNGLPVAGPTTACAPGRGSLYGPHG